jgi:UDP-N-acetylglucosamine 2-epimerase (non-hydrolysing)
MIKYEQLLNKKKSDLCLVVGDVTSTMACAITAQKALIQVAHVEAGIRSGDWTMPEEINRLVTDSITNLFFTTTLGASQILKKSGVTPSKIFFVGNTMIDTLLYHLDELKKPELFDDLKLIPKEYIVVTLHRPMNVDSSANLISTLNAISGAVRGLDVVFPVHPRTHKILKNIQSLPKNIHCVDPQPYLQFNWLVKNSKAVITDSGGITEEATVLGIPCISLRDTTERPETVDIGTNILAGTDPNKLASCLKPLFDNAWKSGKIPDKWDGKAAERILDVLEGLNSRNQFYGN